MKSGRDFFLTKVDNSYKIIAKKVSFSKINLEPAFLSSLGDSFLLPVAVLYRFFIAQNRHLLASHKLVIVAFVLKFQVRC